MVRKYSSRGLEQNKEEKESMTEAEFIAMVQAEVDGLLADADEVIFGTFDVYGTVMEGI